MVVYRERGSVRYVCGKEDMEQPSMLMILMSFLSCSHEREVKVVFGR